VLKITHLKIIGLVAFVVVPSIGFAEGVERTDGFVCPVLSSTVGENNPNTVQIAGGDYSIIGPDVSVPIGATNADGSGTPGGDHSSPGDSDYTAIWSK